MPQGDRTGPRGMGPMTGRGMGWCGRGARFSSPVSPFRGQINPEIEQVECTFRYLDLELVPPTALQLIFP